MHTGSTVSNATGSHIVDPTHIRLSRPTSISSVLTRTCIDSDTQTARVTAQNGDEQIVSPFSWARSGPTKRPRVVRRRVWARPVSGPRPAGSAGRQQHRVPACAASSSPVPRRPGGNALPRGRPAIAARSLAWRHGHTQYHHPLSLVRGHLPGPASVSPCTCGLKDTGDIPTATERGAGPAPCDVPPARRPRPSGAKASDLGTITGRIAAIS